MTPHSRKGKVVFLSEGFQKDLIKKTLCRFGRESSRDSISMDVMSLAQEIPFARHIVCETTLAAVRFTGSRPASSLQCNPCTTNLV